MTRHHLRENKHGIALDKRNVTYQILFWLFFILFLFWFRLRLSLRLALEVKITKIRIHTKVTIGNRGQ